MLGYPSRRAKTSEAIRMGSVTGTMCPDPSAGIKRAPRFWLTVALWAWIVDARIFASRMPAYWPEITRMGTSRSTLGEPRKLRSPSIT